MIDLNEILYYGRFYPDAPGERSRFGGCVCPIMPFWIPKPFGKTSPMRIRRKWKRPGSSIRFSARIYCVWKRSLCKTGTKKPYYACAKIIPGGIMILRSRCISKNIILCGNGLNLRERSCSGTLRIGAGSMDCLTGNKVIRKKYKENGYANSSQRLSHL